MSEQTLAQILSEFALALADLAERVAAMERALEKMQQAVGREA